MRPIPPNLGYKVDPNTWGESIDPTDADLPQLILHRYIARMILLYQVNFCEGVKL
jgi:hypothetical protein